MTYDSSKREPTLKSRQYTPEGGAIDRSESGGSNIFKDSFNWSNIIAMQKIKSDKDIRNRTMSHTEQLQLVTRMMQQTQKSQMDNKKTFFAKLNQKLDKNITTTNAKKRIQDTR